MIFYYELIILIHTTASMNRNFELFFFDLLLSYRFTAILVPIIIESLTEQQFLKNVREKIYDSIDFV